MNENNEITNQNEVIQNMTLEDIRHIDKNGVEYWDARELMCLLGYTKWENFNQVINKAKLVCNISNNDVLNNFVLTKKEIEGKPKNDYYLTRYACYLIVQNADSRKKAVAFAQNYFAYQTRMMELTEYSILSEEEKRLYTRINIKNQNRYLFREAKKSGVEDYSAFNEYGYMGLYNGELARDIAQRKGIDYSKEDILDYMNSAELAANLFRITQTQQKLKNDKVSNEIDAFFTHFTVGYAVRQTIENLGGTMPEDYETPQESVKKLEKKMLKKIK